MRRTVSLHAAGARLGVTAMAMLFVGFGVVSTSRAAFNSTAVNPTNAMATGTVSLADDDTGTAMFNAITGLGPQATTTRCIHVNYVGTLDPDPIVMYVPAPPTGTLGTYLDLTVEIGPGNADAFGSCTSFTSTSTLFTGTLGDFATSHDSYANGLATWDPSSSSSRTFRFTLTVQDNSAAAGLNVGWGFAWEARTA